LPFDGFEKVEIKGPALTKLLAAARDSANVFTSSPPVAQLPTPPTPAELEPAVMDIFRDLLRERYSHDHRVPVHELRAEVESRLGSPSATHALLDPILNGLDRQGRIRLVEIDDRSRATSEQLQASIPAASGTLFFAKRVDHAT
jgi:hypothetical protein